jgi:hypothetical protein
MVKHGVKHGDGSVASLVYVKRSDSYLNKAKCKVFLANRSREPSPRFICHQIVAIPLAISITDGILITYKPF